MSFFFPYIYEPGKWSTVKIRQSIAMLVSHFTGIDIWKKKKRNQQKKKKKENMYKRKREYLLGLKFGPQHALHPFQWKLRWRLLWHLLFMLSIFYILLIFFSNITFFSLFAISSYFFFLFVDMQNQQSTSTCVWSVNKSKTNEQRKRLEKSWIINWMNEQTHDNANIVLLIWHTFS